MPNLLLLVRQVARKIVGYGRDLTPPEVQKSEAERIQHIAAEMRRAGVNTRAVQRAAEIRHSARD